MTRERFDPTGFVIGLFVCIVIWALIGWLVAWWWL
jgi:hypothetical protein